MSRISEKSPITIKLRRMLQSGRGTIGIDNGKKLTVWSFVTKRNKIVNE